MAYLRYSSIGYYLYTTNYLKTPTNEQNTTILQKKNNKEEKEIKTNELLDHNICCIQQNKAKLGRINTYNRIDL